MRYILMTMLLSLVACHSGRLTGQWEYVDGTKGCKPPPYKAMYLINQDSKLILIKNDGTRDSGTWDFEPNVVDISYLTFRLTWPAPSTYRFAYYTWGDNVNLQMVGVGRDLDPTFGVAGYDFDPKCIFTFRRVIDIL